jgi:hypothetical protein
MLCQVSAVVGAREASERIGCSGSGHRKDQQDSSERDPVHFSSPCFDAIIVRPTSDMNARRLVG